MLRQKRERNEVEYGVWLVEKIKEIFLRLERKWILQKVRKDKTIEKKEVPEEVHDAIFAEIRRMEEEWERERQMIAQLSDENQELIRLGKVYKRNLPYRKYTILAAILALTFAMGITSFGSAERMFHKITSMICGRTRETVDSDGVKEFSNLNEEEVFAEIEEMYGVFPVRFGYLPEGTELLEASIMSDVLMASIMYGTGERADIVYDITCEYVDNSWSKDIEDNLNNHFVVNQYETLIDIKEFEVESEARWLIQFSYKKLHYKIHVTGMEQSEIENIVEHLQF
jgi:hypothetical protein